MMKIAFLLALVSTTMACSCYPQSNNDAYCRADSVSHVKVMSYNNPHDDHYGFHDVSYDLQYIEIYKQPNSTATLPSTIYTQSSDALCGISMQVGKEYLLTGYIRGNGAQRGYLCTQVGSNRFGNVQEWEKVPVELRASLSTIKC